MLVEVVVPVGQNAANRLYRVRPMQYVPDTFFDIVNSSTGPASGGTGNPSVYGCRNP
jgi:hypothetical protein